MFNALKYTKTLEENGFNREQAEILVRMFMQMLEFNMVTKSDFESFQKSDFLNFKKSNRYEFEKVNKRIDGLEERLTYEIHKLSLQLTVKLGVMLAISVGLISTIIALKL